MSDIRKSLAQIADTIEKLQESSNKKPQILDRELSGNKINGGKITQFSSQGIEDKANRTVLVVDNNGIHTKRMYVESLEGNVCIHGDLKVTGKLESPNSIDSNINDRTIELVDNNSNTFDEGILWRNNRHTSQLVLKDNPHRIWTNENIDIARGKEYRIANQSVLTENALGNSVTESKLKTVGRLTELNTAGSVTVGDLIKLDPENNNISIGTDNPLGFLTIDNLDHQFVLDYDKTWRIGSYTSSDLSLVTDDRERIHVSNTGKITVFGKTVFDSAVSIGVNNPLQDVDFTIAGSIRFCNKKQEVGFASPNQGSYQKGDIVWNQDPKPTDFIGWVCVREGTPGEWKPFGQISG
jgi:hypothetical protein